MAAKDTLQNITAPLNSRFIQVMKIVVQLFMQEIPEDISGTKRDISGTTKDISDTGEDISGTRRDTANIITENISMIGMGHINIIGTGPTNTDMDTSIRIIQETIITGTVDIADIRIGSYDIK